MLKIFCCSIALLALPVVTFAQETVAKSPLTVFYEKSFGPIGAVAGLLIIMIFWRLSKKVEGNFKFMLKIFSFILSLEIISSLMFAFSGNGFMSDEMSRYIERTLRLAALLTSDIVALILFVKINRNKTKELNQ